MGQEKIMMFTCHGLSWFRFFDVLETFLEWLFVDFMLKTASKPGRRSNIYLLYITAFILKNAT